MNYHIDAQCVQMLLLVKNFENACELAALKDDGKCSKEEEKVLKRIHKASVKFTKDLQNLSPR